MSSMSVKNCSESEHVQSERGKGLWMKFMIGGIAITFICLLIGTIIAVSVNKDPEEISPYKWSGCQNLGKCHLDGFSKPPLVILSFDGFAREYLERKIVKSLELIAECGAKADRVYPSFPSKTFPNHYTMMTGLWPESHGITDNSVFDPSISSEFVAMRKSESGKFYGGEPIWSAYKRLTGRPAHCLFWVGCYFNNTGYMPDVSPEYNQELPLQDRIDTLVSWLQLPARLRPGLITAYLHQPDEAGHKQTNRGDVDKALEDVDKYIDTLMTTLHDEQLLECINLVIVSDHGMQVLDKFVNVGDHIDLKGTILSKGVVARIHLNGTKRSVEEVADEMRCKVDGIKVNTKKDIPTRKHYSRTDRVGDLIIEGKPGTAFYESGKTRGDHGYDYLLENMHTVMFARGPAFRKNVTIPPYQNVQYMNLWLSLLGLEGAVENNGTIGFFDSILEAPPARENNWNVIEECPSLGPAEALACVGGTLSDQKRNKLSSQLQSCKHVTSVPVYSNNHCFQSYCDNVIISSRKNSSDPRKTLIEVLTAPSADKSGLSDGNFSFVNTKYSSGCPGTNTSQFFSSGSDDISRIADAQFAFPNSFLKNVLAPLQEKTSSYLQKFRKLFVLSGTATDANLDGIADDQGYPTHFYRIIVTCAGGRWLSSSPPTCKKVVDMKALAFVFPILDGKSTMDCMDPDALLLEYTSTIEDVGRIAGFQFQIGPLTHQQNVYLRRNITTSIW